MSKASSVPRRKTYSEDSNMQLKQSKLPKITKKSLSKISMYDNKEMQKKYSLLNKDVSNAIDNINNDLNTRLKARNEVTQEQIKDIQNNYYEIKYLLDNKIDKLEKNQKKVFDFMKFSLEQDKLKNGMNSIKYHGGNQNYIHQNSLGRDNVLNILKGLPSIIHNKMNQIYQEELEENRNQNRFLNDLRNQVFSELRDQRRQDNLKYNQQIE